MTAKGFFSRIGAAFKALNAKRKAFDQRMRRRYAPAQLAVLCCGVMAVIIVVFIFIPPYVGLSNDGSFDAVMADTGLKRLDSETYDGYFDYYERTYLIEKNEYASGSTPWLLQAAIRVAIALDSLVTGDIYFDVRALAFVYAVLYLLALFPVFRFMLSRVSYYSEGLVVGAVSVIIFGDISILARFASFSTQPLELICFLGIVGSLLDFSRDEKPYLRLSVLLVLVVALMRLNPYCALAGVVFSICFWRMFLQKRETMLKTFCVFCAVALCFVSSMGLVALQQRMTPIRQYNAMTRGVLFQAEDPVQALAEFGIEARYSVLADTYAEQNYPVVLPESGLLDEGFLNKYDPSGIWFYYLRHPGSLAGIFDVAVKAAFQTRPDFSGNYEQSLGLPPRAKEPLMTLWSNFKSQSAPKTAALYVILAAGILIVFGRKHIKMGQKAKKQQSNLLAMLAVIVIFGAVELMTVIVYSGDSEIMREAYLMSCHMDVMVMLFASETLHRLDIIRGEGEE